MTEGIDHDRCSELLAAYVRNELDAPDHSEVERHLSTCVACQGEESALRALLGTEVPPLSDEDRVALHRTVWAAVAPRKATVVPLRRRRERTAQILGAAALLAVLATGLFYLVGTGGGDFGGDAATVEAGGGESQDSQAGGGAGAARTNDEALENKEESAAAQPAQDAVRARPTFAPEAGMVTDDELRDVARSKLFRNFSDLGSKTTRARARLTSDLARQAPEDLSDQVRSCARRVYDTSSGGVLPAYGAAGELEGRKVLVLGFAHSKAAGGPLDRFMFWAWPQGGCKPLVDYQEGPIPDRP